MNTETNMNDFYTPKISEVLHYAADKCLAYKTRTDYFTKFSCLAVEEALRKLTDNLNIRHTLKTNIFQGLEEMGCGVYSCHLFVEYGDEPMAYQYLNSDVQGMRYIWLKWAALMAEEQGQ